MTVDEIRARVEDIRAISGDDEAAHGAEDELRADVLRYIARSDELPMISVYTLRNLAREALRTGEINFSRWCA